MKDTDTKANLLIVEDDRFIRKLYKEILKDIDKIALSELETAENAIEHIKEHKPDLVIMDYHLPGMNGLEATKQIIMAHPDTIVLVISGDDRSSLEEEMLEIGAVSFLKKPIRGKMLYFTIMNFVEIILTKKNLKQQVDRQSVKLAETQSENEFRKSNEECLKAEESNVTFIKGFENKALEADNPLLNTDTGEIKSASDFLTAIEDDTDIIDEFIESYDELKFAVETLEDIVDPDIFRTISERLRENSSKADALLEFPTITFTLSTINDFIEKSDIESMCDIPIKKLAVFFGDFIDMYDQWYKSVFVNKSAEDIHFMDVTLMSFAMQIDSIFSDVNVLNEDDESAVDEGGSIEFF